MTRAEAMPLLSHREQTIGSGWAVGSMVMTFTCQTVTGLTTSVCHPIRTTPLRSFIDCGILITVIPLIPSF